MLPDTRRTADRVPALMPLFGETIPEVHEQPASNTGASSVTLFHQPLPPELEHQRGLDAGRAEAREALAQAEAAKGEALTRAEIMACYQPRFTEHMLRYERGEVSAPFSDGWRQGYVEAIFAAHDAAPAEISVRREASELMEPEEPFVVAATVRFRQAAIRTDDADEFAKGIECGQTCFVGDRLIEDQAITTRSLADLFVGALEADDPEAYNIGFIVGYIDALCRARKTYPGGAVSSPKKTKKRARKR
jgi:hypothetical protein